MRDHFLGYQCSICQAKYDCAEVVYTCPLDGGNLDIVLDTVNISKDFSPQNFTNQIDKSIWKYLPLLPVQDPGYVDTPLRTVGATPTYAVDPQMFNHQLRYVWVKDESRNPTASFKDRASALVVSRSLEIGAEFVVTASTGNAGAALAGMTAAVGKKAIIFAPKTAPQAKVAQLLTYGAKVLLVDGTYDDAFDLSILAAQEFGWYCRNTGYNPFTLEGKKTAALEIWSWWIRISKLAKFSNDLSIFVSVGDGNIISGLHKGFKDLQSLGWLEKIPRLFGVQAEGSAAVADAFFRGDERILPVKANTLADSISVDLPRDGIRAVRAVSETKGQYIIVSDLEILNAISDLGRIGVFSEPAGAASYAGLVKSIHQNLINENDPVLVLNTGSGLKDVNAAMKSVQAPPIIEPTLAAVKQYLV